MRLRGVDSFSRERFTSDGRIAAAAADYGGGDPLNDTIFVSINFQLWSRLLILVGGLWVGWLLVVGVGRVPVCSTSCLSGSPRGNVKGSINVQSCFCTLYSGFSYVCAFMVENNH